MRETATLSGPVDGLRRDKRRGPYDGHREYVHTAWAVHEEAGRLLDAGQAALVAPELRKAVERITTALMYLDDSAGMAGDVLRELTGMYARALTAAPPKNPKTLASWIAKTVFDGPGWPDIRLADFAAALGEVGQAHLAEMVDARAADVSLKDSWTTVNGVRHLREQLAEVSGDTDRYVAVLAQFLTGPDQYMKIVRALRAADRPEEATDWARRGVAADPGNPYLPKLNDELVDLLVAAGRREEALAVHRDAFARTTVLAAFQPLARTASELESPDTVTWALDLLRTRAAENPAYVRELISCLRAAGRPEEAWQTAVGHLGELSKYTLQELIEERRTTHPADTITPYRRLVDLYLAETGNKYRYQYAVRHLKTLRTIHREQGTEAEFAAYLTILRDEHRRKTSFLTRLDQADLT
jgi:hypothetical protein